MTSTLFLSSEEVFTVARSVGVDQLMDELIARLEQACRAYDPERCVIPPRTGFHYTAPHVGLVEWMPLMEREDRILLKMVGYHPDNPTAYHLPTILCTLALFDAKTGHLLTIADGTFLTALRTGAASAVASRLLAHPESRTLGLIGAGAQAVTQLHAISRIFPIERVLVHDLDRSRAATFESRVKPLAIEGLSVEVRTPQELLPEVDILCTATSIGPGDGPVFDADLPTKPWLHINAVGSDFPGKIEVPLEHLKRSFVCPDFREQVEREGECQQLQDEHIGPDWVDVTRDRDAFRDRQEQLTVFDSTGFALEDHVALELLLERASERGLGTSLNFESITPDPYAPYQFLESSRLTPRADLNPKSAPSTPVGS